MDLLGVGPLELIFVFLIIFLVLGPKDIAATGKKLGRFFSTVRKSEFWRGVTQVSKEVRSLPTTLMREAELEDIRAEMQNDLKEVRTIAREFDQGELREIGQELKSASGAETDSGGTGKSGTSEPKSEEPEDKKDA
jgi:Sec-independent protein translocase protein TatA